MARQGKCKRENLITQCKSIISFPGSGASGFENKHGTSEQLKIGCQKKTRLMADEEEGNSILPRTSQASRFTGNTVLHCVITLFTEFQHM